jgi:hypothetical protein
MKSTSKRGMPTIADVRRNIPKTHKTYLPLRNHQWVFDNFIGDAETRRLLGKWGFDRPGVKLEQRFRYMGTDREVVLSEIEQARKGLEPVRSTIWNMRGEVERARSNGEDTVHRGHYLGNFIRGIDASLNLMEEEAKRTLR